MKQYLKLFSLLLLLLLCFSACKDTQKKSEMLSYKSEVSYESGVYHDKDWTETEPGTYKGAAIPDKETALHIATAIFDGMEKSEEAKAFTAQKVFFDTEDEIWIVSFWEEPALPDDMLRVGNDCSIALQKSDGKVLRICFGE